MQDIFFQYLPNRHHGIGYAYDLRQRPLRANFMYVRRNCLLFRHVKTTLRIYIEEVFNDINITYLIHLMGLIGLTYLIDKYSFIPTQLTQGKSAGAALSSSTVHYYSYEYT